MKRILSVILSLALLASLLIIPMSVSAGNSNNYDVVQFGYADKDTYYSPDRNVSLGITPYVYVTDNTATTPARYQITNANIPKLSTGEFSGNDIKFDGQGFYFRKKGADNTYSGDPLNGYVLTNPPGDFNFDQESFEGYVDIVYDLGAVIDINKVQHFASSTNISLGAYSFYAAESAGDLFKSESKVFDYQNKDWGAGGCQSHTFNTVTARYAAFRVYYPIVFSSSTGKDYYNTLRIKELAIYGTLSNTADYKVKEVEAPTSDTPIPVDEGDLLNADTFESVVAYEDGELKGTWIYNSEDAEDWRNPYMDKLNSQTYLKYGHGDFQLATFYSGGICKNRYSFDRTAVDGNINFIVPEQETEVYYDFTYDLGEYYKIDRFGAYLSNRENRRVQVYEVYIGNDRDELYNGEPVVVYNNYYNTYGQMITFVKPITGKYIGFRVLNSGTATDDGVTYVRLDELAAYGECVGTPPAIDVAPGETCGSAILTVTDVNANLKSVIVNDVEKVTDENKEAVKAKYEETLNKGEYTVVATDDKGNVTTEKFTVADHNYQYTADGAVITETCANCDHSATAELKLIENASLVYNNEDKSTSIEFKKSDGFAGEGEISFYKNDEKAESVVNAGDYVAKVTIGDATAELPFTIKKANPTYEVPTGFEAEAGGKLKDIVLPSNFTWGNPNGIIKYDVKEYAAVFTPEDTDNYNEVALNIPVTVTDTTAPTGEIKIKNKTWIEEVVDVLFGWFINKQETVTITGSDNYGSGVDKIYYYVADAKLDSFENIEWIEYPEEGFKIEQEGNNVVYAKVVDKAGNSSAIINTDGIVLDATAPVADVTDLGKYYGSLTVTVTEDNLDTVKLNDEVVTLEDGKFTVSAADKEQTIVITDMAGNETTYTVTVVEVKGLVPADGKLTVDMDEKKVDEADKEKVAQEIKKSEKITYKFTYFDISVDNANSTTTNVLEVPVDFDFTGRLDVKVLHNHGGDVKTLTALTARPTADFENGTFFADVENKLLYIYTKEFSTFAVAYHEHEVKHVEAKAATAEADGNIEYWYCEGCDKYFSDAAATKEIQKADTVVKYVAPSNGNNGSNNAATGGENATNPTVPGGTSPVTGETAMTVVLFAILLGALAVMGISIVKSRKAKSK